MTGSGGKAVRYNTAYYAPYHEHSLALPAKGLDPTNVRAACSAAEPLTNLWAADMDALSRRFQGVHRLEGCSLSSHPSTLSVLVPRNEYPPLYGQTSCYSEALTFEPFSAEVELKWAWEREANMSVDALEGCRASRVQWVGNPIGRRVYTSSLIRAQDCPPKLGFTPSSSS